MNKSQLINGIIYYSENMYTEEDLKGYSKKALRKMHKREKKRCENG